MNTNQADSADYLIRTEKYKDTIFTIVSQEDKYFIAVGKTRITDNLKSKEECIELIEGKDGDIIVRTIIAMITLSDEIK